MKTKLTKILWGTLTLIASFNTWGQYTLENYAIGCGGGACAAGPYVLSATIGQPVASERMTSGHYSLTGGFWGETAVTVSKPSLSIMRSGPSVIISWSSTFTGYSLQSASDLQVGSVWAPVSQPAVQIGNEYRVTVPISQAKRFFRLVL